MAQFVVRQLEDDVKRRLQRRARRHGRSMEEEVRHILRNAAKEDTRRARNLGSRIAARFEKIGLREGLPEMRGTPVRSVDFDE